MSNLKYWDYEFDAMAPIQEDSDYDDLYDTIETFVDEQLPELGGVDDSIETVGTQYELNQLQAEHDELNNIYTQLNERIEVVGEEMDVSYFYQSRKPLENKIKKLNKVIKASGLFLKVKEKIEKHRREVVTLIQDALEADDFEEVADLEDGFDMMVDHCDAIADSIYELENDGQEIGPLESKFHSLTTMMERLQDVIDDAIYRLSS